MSVNIDLTFEIGGLADMAAVKAVVPAVRRLLDSERIDSMSGRIRPSAKGGFSVSCESDYALSVSRSYQWCPEFEQALAECVRQFAPTADVQVYWDYRDED
ncbi:hypothetical protein ACFVUS_05835 [Nocardia sp. NPDC058058]|uniref:hypothetical protein n=1 Tax=Nocardia sp. NPDC058058 TaxID=3346317 RepID=UPI0036DE1D33